MKKRTIVVIECISSSVNYIQDIIDEGYEPVLVEMPVPEEEKDEARFMHDVSIDILYTDLYEGAKRPRIIQASENYEETLKMIKALDPVLVLPGGDEGIIPAAHIAHDLGLITNNPENLPKMRVKSVAQEALKQKGIRSIQGITSSSWEEVLEFYHSLGSKKIVVKPISGGASVGVCICDNEEDLKKSFLSDLKTARALDGDDAKVLLQEYIGGEEYIVNTASCRGVHKVTALLAYEKKLIPGKAPIYLDAFTLSPESETGKQLVEYALKVVDAIGIEYGPVHSEIKIDEHGPVLIEANCRLCGGMQRATWQDRAYGERESRTSLRTYLHPEQFLADPKTVLMKMDYMGCEYYLSMNDDLYVKKNNVGTAFCDIEAVDYAIGMGDDRLYPRTVDFATTAGLVFLSHKDIDVIKRSIKTMTRIAEEEPERIFEF